MYRVITGHGWCLCFLVVVDLIRVLRKPGSMSCGLMILIVMPRLFIV